MSKFIKLKVKQFQAHEESEVLFDPGFNLIIGPSDKGKSSLMRAVEWVRTNRPRGADNILNHNADEVEVEILTETALVKRKRTEKGTGSYSVNESEEFSVMGSDIPPLITESLNLGDINIQLQLDGHFLILDTPGKAASQINKITKLDKIDGALGRLKSLKTETTKEHERLNQELVEVGNFLESGVYDTAYNLEKIKDSVILKITKRTNIVSKLTVAISAIDKISFIKEEKKELETVWKAKKIVDEIETQITKITDISNSITGISLKIRSIKETKEEIEFLDKKRTDLIANQKEIESELDVCPYCGSGLTNDTKRTLLRKR